MIYATFVEIFVLVSLTRKKMYLVQDTLYQYSGLFFQIQLLNTIILRLLQIKFACNFRNTHLLKYDEKERSH